MAQNWFNNDGLFIQYGTDKAIPTTAGEYVSYGDLRETVIKIDLTTLTSSAVIQDNVCFIPSGVVFEQVEVIADEVAASGTSFSIGLVKQDRTTALSTTAFVAAMVTASVDTLGEKNILNKGTTYAGAYLGTTSTDSGYITALASGTYTTGKVQVRIKWRNISKITQ